LLPDFVSPSPFHTTYFIREPQVVAEANVPEGDTEPEVDSNE
jgi:hypothetical protein